MQALICLLILLLPELAQGKNLFVSPGGDDSVTYASNSPERPWASIGRAAWGSRSRAEPNPNEAARAGDVVRIASGTYVTTGNTRGGGGGRWDVAYNPVNEGADGSPIRFECVEAGRCVLTYSSGAGPMIGSNMKDFIEWSGFSVSEATAPTRPDTGPVTFMGVTGGSIERTTLTGNPAWATRQGDNYNGVRLEDATGVRIAHNLIRDFGGELTDRNHSGITIYRSFPVTIEHNRIENCANGIYMKAVNPSTLAVNTVVIRLNRFVNNRWGINALRMPMTQEHPMLIYQNLFERNRASGVWVAVFDNGPSDATWIRVFNNTFVDNDSGLFSYNNAIWKPMSQHLYVNNIIVGTGLRLRMDTTDVKANSTTDRQSYDRNLYGSGKFSEMGGDERSFSSWQKLGQDRNSVTVAGSQFADGDYRLTPNSLARTLGRAVHGIGGAEGTTVPAGAYITGQEHIGPIQP